MASVSDNFNRADGALGSDWVKIAGNDLAISGNAVTQPSNTGSSVYFDQSLGSDDHTSEIDNTVTGGTFAWFGNIIRFDPTAGTGYIAILFRNGADSYQVIIYRWAAGVTSTQLAATATIAGFPTAPINLKTKIEGSTITAFVNDVQALQVDDSLYTSGEYAGFAFTRTGMFMDNFEAADVTVPSGLGLSIAASSAVAVWTLDEESGSRADSVGSNTLSDNNTVGFTAGKFGNAADFVAANEEYLSIDTNAAVEFGDTTYTIRCWIKMRSLTDNQYIIGKWRSGTREYLLYYDFGTSRFVWILGQGNNKNVGSVTADNFGAASVDTWYLLHAWHSAVDNQIGISVNAGTADTNNISLTPGIGNPELFIGSFSTGQNDFFDGQIDDVVFLADYILDETERSEDYNGGVGRAYSTWGGPVLDTDPGIAEGSGRVGEQLTGVRGSYTFTGSITYLDQWFIADDNVGTNETEIVGATLQNYTVTEGQTGYIRRRETATDDNGSTVTFTAYVPIANPLYDTGISSMMSRYCPTLVDSADDLIGPFDGTYQGGMGTIADTGAGGVRAYEFFENSDHYIQTTGEGILGTNPWSVSFWADSNNESFFIYWGDEATLERVRISWRTQSILRFEAFGTRAFANDAGNLNDGQWHHIVITKPENGSADDLNFYIDGVSQNVDTDGSSTLPLNPLASPVGLRIGSFAGSDGEITGRMDDIILFNAALTQEQVTTLYDSGEGRGFVADVATGFAPQQLLMSTLSL